MHGVRRAAENGELRGSALGLCVLIEGATAPVRAREAPTVTVMHTTLCAKYIDLCSACQLRRREGGMTVTRQFGNKGTAHGSFAQYKQKRVLP